MIRVANAIPFGAGKGNVYLNNGSTFSINAQASLSVNGLFGNGIITNDGGSGTTKGFSMGNGDANGDFSGTLQDKADGLRWIGVSKVGTGTQILRGPLTYREQTSVTGGTLKIMSTTGTIASGLLDILTPGILDVSDYGGSTFAYGSSAQTTIKSVTGTGKIAGSMKVAGASGFATTVAPGRAAYAVTVTPPVITTNRAGQLNVDNLAFDDYSVLAIDIQGLARGAEGGYDVLNVIGALNLSPHANTLNSLVVTSTYVPVLGDSFDIMDWGTLNGTFGTVSPLPTLTPGLYWDYDLDPSHTQFYSTGTLTVVPEPSTWALLMLAAMGLGIYWNRKR